MKMEGFRVKISVKYVENGYKVVKYGQNVNVCILNSILIIIFASETIS